MAPAAPNSRNPREADGIPAWPWILVGLVTVPLAAVGLVVWYGLYGVVLFGDVPWYAAALPALFSDAPLYDPAYLQPHSLHQPAYWNLPPTTALFSLILTLPAGAWLWGMLMAAGVIVGLIVMWPRVGIGGIVLLAPVLVLWRPVIEAVAWANVNALVFGLLAIAWRYPRWAGWAIGVASVAKLLPLVAIAWLAGKRDWRGVGIGLGLFVAATVVIAAWKGPSSLTDFVILRLNEFAPADSGPGVGFSELLGVSPVLGYAAAVVLTILAFRFASFSLAVMAMIVSVPTFHLHYWTWMLVPILGEWIPWMIAKLNDRNAPVAASATRAAVRPTES